MWLGNNLHVCVCVCVSECVYINMNPSRYVSPTFPTFPTFPSFPSFHISLLAPLLKNLFGPPISSCTETNKQNKTTKKKRQTCVRWFSSIQISKRQCCNIGFIYTWLIRRHTLVYIFFIRFSSSWSYRSDLLLCAGMDWIDGIDGIDFGNTNEIRPAQWVALVESQPEHWHHNDMNPAQQMATKTPSTSHPPI